MLTKHVNLPRNGFQVTESNIEQVREVVARMVQSGGCAWHGEQTHESLTKYLVEETAEFIDAVDRGLPAEIVADELGDVLYQVLFHAAIAARDGEGYNLDTVAQNLAEKLIARHPHVFADRGYMSVEELNQEWEHLKEDAAGARRGTRGPFDGIPRSMPTLARAAKMINRLRRHASGLENLPEPSGQLGSIENESEFGEALLQLIAAAESKGVDADRALRLALAQLETKFVEE